MFAYDNGGFIMLDNKNNKYYGVDSGCGSPQNWGNLQSAYSLRSHQSWWTSKSVKGAVLGLGLATLLPLTNAFAADSVDVTISGWNPGNAIHIPYGTDLTDRNTYLRNDVGAYNVTVKAGDKTLKLGTEGDPQEGIVKFNVEHLQRYGASSSPVDKVWLEFIPTDRTKYKPASTKDTQSYDLYVDKINVTFAGRAYPDYTTDASGNYYNTTTKEYKSLYWTQSSDEIYYNTKLEGTLNKIRTPKDPWNNHSLRGTLTFTIEGNGVNITGSKDDLKNKTDLPAGDYTVTATFVPGKDNSYDDTKNYTTGATDYNGSADWRQAANLPYDETHPLAKRLTLKVKKTGLGDKFKLSAGDLEEIEYGTWLKDLITEKALANGSDEEIVNGGTYVIKVLNNKGKVDDNASAEWNKDEKFAIAGKTDGKGMEPKEIPNPAEDDIYDANGKRPGETGYDPATAVNYYDLRKNLPNFQVGNTYPEAPYTKLRLIFSYPNYDSVEVDFTTKVVKATPKLIWPSRKESGKQKGYLPELEVNKELDYLTTRLNLTVEPDPVNGRPLDPRVYENDETEDSENYTLPVVKYTINNEVVHGDTKMTAAGEYTVVAEYDIGKRNPERDYYFGAAPATVSTTAKLKVFAKDDPTVNWPIEGKTVEIPYGTALTEDNVLNATGKNGTITYTLNGNVLEEIPDVSVSGAHTVTMTFTPDDPVHYNTVVKTARLVVYPVLPELDWNPSFFYGHDTIDRMRNINTFRNNLEAKPGYGKGQQTFRIPYGLQPDPDKVNYSYVEVIPDIGTCYWYVIDELGLNNNQTLSSAIRQLVQEIQASEVPTYATAFVVGYDFSKGDNIEQYIGCNQSNCPQADNYKTPVHFVAVGQKAYRFLNTLTPEEEPYTGFMTIKPYEQEHGIGYGFQGSKERGYERADWNYSWKDQDEMTISYGAILGQVYDRWATNAFYATDAFGYYNDHYLAPFQEWQNNQWVYPVWDNNRPGNITYEIYSNDGTISYDAAATQDILDGKRALDVHKVFDGNNNLVWDKSDYTLVAVFTPFDTRNYAPARESRRLNVEKQYIAVAWQPKEYIFYGEFLSADQLNAKFTTWYLGDGNYNMNDRSSVTYSYCKATTYGTRDESWTNVSLDTASLRILEVLVPNKTSANNYDYVLRVTCSPRDSNNYEPRTVDRNFSVNPTELTIMPRDMNLPIGTQKPAFEYDDYKFQFNDKQKCPAVQMDTDPATPAPPAGLSQGTYTIYVKNQTQIKTKTGLSSEGKWNPDNYHITFKQGNLYVGKNPIIEWGTPEDAIIDLKYGTQYHRLDAKAFDPNDPTRELEGEFTYTFAGNPIDEDTDIEAYNGTIGARTLYAKFKPAGADADYLPSTSQVELWVKDRPELGWDVSKDGKTVWGNLKVPYGVGVTKDDIVGWTKVWTYTDQNADIKSKGNVTYTWAEAINPEDTPDKATVGSYELTLKFAPVGTTNWKKYTSAYNKVVVVEVVPADPIWEKKPWDAEPKEITYGTRLSDKTHLSAKVVGPTLLLDKNGNAKGTVDYVVNNPPPAGEKVELKAIFTPTDNVNFNKSTNYAYIKVNKANFTADWVIADNDKKVTEFTYGTSVLDPNLYEVKATGRSTNPDDSAPLSVAMDKTTVTLDGKRLYKDNGTPVDHPADVPDVSTDPHVLKVTIRPVDSVARSNFEPLPKERKLKVNPQEPTLNGAWDGTKTIEFGTVFNAEWFSLKGKVLGQTVDVDHDPWTYTITKWTYTNRDKKEGGYKPITESKPNFNPETDLLDFNVDAYEAGVEAAYQVVVTAVPKSSNYKKVSTAKLNLKVVPTSNPPATYQTDDPTKNIWIYPLDEDGNLIEGKPIERAWSHNGVDFTAMVRTLSTLNHPAENGRVLEGTYTMTLTPVDPDVELSADGTSGNSAQSLEPIKWTTRASDASTKAAKKITRVPSGKYHISVTFNPWGYLNPYNSKKPYDSKDYNTSDYVGPVTRATKTDASGIATDVFLLYIDPEVYIKTAWDSEGEGYDEAKGDDPYPYLKRLMNPLTIRYPYADSSKHKYEISKLAANPIDAEYYASQLGTAVVKGEFLPMTWAINGVEQETVPDPIEKLEPGKYTLTLKFKADWDEYRHYFDGIWTKTINFDVYQIDPVASWDPEETYYAEPEFYTVPGEAQRNGVADVPGTFYYPGADMSKTGINKKLWPSTSWPNWVNRDEDGNVIGHTVYATFQPKDTVTYKTIRVPGYLVVNPEEVETIWEPAPMNYGDTPGDAQFNAMAIPVHNGAVILNDKYGTFDYPTTNWPKEAGQHTVVAIFNPNEPNNYVDYEGNPGHNGDYPIRATGLLTINAVEAPFEWNPKPLTMTIDQAFMKSQLSGAVKKKVSGTTEFYCDDIRVFEDSKTPEQLGIAVGPNHELKAVFKPTSADYEESTKVVNLAITDGKITIEWTPASTIGYTTPLDTESYLNAKAYRNGESLPDDGFTYTPAAGTTAQQAQIEAGAEWKLTATYTLEGEKPVVEERFITVEPAKLIVDFTESEVTIEYGQLLDEDVPSGAVATDIATEEPFYGGVFTYSVAPIDEDGTIGETITTTKMIPNEEGEEVEVTVNVDPSVDTLDVGVYALTATFTPDDQETYGPAVTTKTPATLTVIQTEPVVTITGYQVGAIRLPYGMQIEEALGSWWTYGATNKWNDVNVEAESREYTFVDEAGNEVKPTAEEPLPVGIYDMTMTLYPVDDHNYTNGIGTAQLTVGRATPVITWYPEPIEFAYGKELPESVLTAKASNADGKEVEGTFDYLLNGVLIATTPFDEEHPYVPYQLVNMLGVQELTAVFNPANTNSYTSPRETVELHVYEGSLTRVTIWADDKTITYGQTADLTYKVNPAGAAEAELSTTYKGEFAGIYDIIFDSVTPKDDTYAIANPIPGRLTVNPATPTVEFYELLTKDGEESVSEEPLQTIPLIYGDVMEFDTTNAVITITNPNISEVESASDDTVANSGAEGGNEPVVVRTIKVVAKDINGKEMELESINFSLDGEQPLLPQDEAYTLTVTPTYGNANYVDAPVTIPVTVTADEDALNVEWPVINEYTWSEGLVWGDFITENAEATIYGVVVADKDDLTYLMAKLPADATAEGIDPKDLVAFDPKAPVDGAGVYYLVASYTDEIYGTAVDENIVLIAEPEPVYQDLTVTVDKQQLVYGTPINEKAYTVKPAEFQNVVKAVIVPEADYVGNVGTYDLFVEVDETTIPEGYKLVTPVPGIDMLEVTPLSVTVTALDQTIKAGEQPDPNKYTIDPQSAANAVSVALDFGGYAGVAGKYVITPAAATDNLNYTIAEPVKGTLTVTELVSVTIVPVAAPITYGDPAPAQTAYSYEPADVKIIGTPKYSTIYTAGLPASASGYDIFIDNPNELKAEGYDVVFAKHGKLVVNKATPEFTVVPSTTSLKVGETLTVSWTTDSDGDVTTVVKGTALKQISATEFEAVEQGDATITVALAEAKNYLGTTADVAVTVTKKDPIQVTVTAITEEGMVYGEEALNYLDYTVEPEVDGTLIYAVEGIDNDYIGEIDPALDKFQTLPAGTYNVTPKFTPTPVEGEEYEITEVPATLTVESAVSVVWNPESSIEYGNLIECNAKVYVDGEEVENPEVIYYLDNEGTPLPEWPLDVNSYEVKAVFIAPLGADYSGAETDWMPVEVTPLDATVTAESTSVTYGDPAPAVLTATFEGLIDADVDAIEATVEAIGYTAGSPVKDGGYPTKVVALIGDKADNYNWTVKDGTLTVEKAEQYVTLVLDPNPTVLNVGDSATATVVTTSGLTEFTLVISDPSILSPNLVALKVGTVEVFAEQAGDNNYKPAKSNTVTVTVAPKADAQITWEPKSPITYGTILSAEHLNATATLDGEKVEGHFYYNPTFGYVVTPESKFVVNGKLKLSATFIPTDRKRFKNAYTEVLVDIVVEEDDTTDDGEEAPALSINKAGSVKGLVNAAADALVITFTGTLEESTDGVTWTPVVGAEDGTYVVDVKVASQKFYRSVK